LADLLWSCTTGTGLPDLPYFAATILNLPAPKSINLSEKVKTYILGLSPQTYATLDAAGKFSGLRSGLPHRLLQEVSLATKPLIRLLGKAHGTVEWTPDESKQL